MAPEHVVKIEFMYSPIGNKLPDHWCCLQFRIACSAPQRCCSSNLPWTVFASWMAPLSCWKRPRPPENTVPGWAWFGTMLRWVACVKVTSSWMAGHKVPQQNIYHLLPMMHLGPVHTPGKAHRSTRPGQLPTLLDGPDRSASMHCVFWRPSIRTSKNFFSHLSSSNPSVGSNWDQPSIPPYIYELQSY